MITIKSNEEIAILREGGRRHAEIMNKLLSLVKPGVSSVFLDSEALRMIKENGDKPAFLGYKPSGAKRPFPSTLCVSVNDEVVHGISNEKEKILKEGDIVGLDLGMIHKEMYTDMAVTVAVGEITPEVRKLLDATKESLSVGIRMVKEGNTTGDIGEAISAVGERNKYGIVQELSGHGVGYDVHEDPYVPNYGKAGTGDKLKAGMVIAIEPMFNLGSRKIYLGEDGYTYYTADGKPSAHFEHTVLVTERGGEILTKI